MLQKDQRDQQKSGGRVNNFNNFAIIEYDHKAVDLYI